MQLETSDRILSHSPSLLETYYKDDAQPQNSSWNGTVSSNGGMSSQFMYKVNVSHGQLLDLTGNPVDINSWSFPIQANWNWVPFPVSANVQVNAALASFNAQDGNVIKSQNLFAIYDAVSGWSGTLNYLVEGQGYMLKSSDNQTLVYPNYFGRFTSDSNSIAEQRVIASEFAQYAENMNAVVLMPSGYDNLFVYDANGIVKGQVTSQNVGDNELSFITIYGDLPEALIFHIGNASETKPTTKVFSFKSNQVLGTIADPVILEDEMLYGITVFPNPFENHLNLKVNSKQSQMVSVQIHNMLGQVVFSDEISVEEGENDLRIVPNLSLGAYFLNVNVNNNTSVFRVIKN
ncbi:T9SS type A sorting domain-containing protein [Lacinutrix himadriensis]|uniref:T9SS type A sorting domain-containing protein n=1 Tax=Lacinutrix himadriensis TaxID=641549 RepID=UPI0006E3D63F|nr:T9SS type A sorting domain-containing protein [Lacinutrix himadriensis]